MFSISRQLLAVEMNVESACKAFSERTQEAAPDQLENVVLCSPIGPELRCGDAEMLWAPVTAAQSTRWKSSGVPGECFHRTWSWESGFWQVLDACVYSPA